MNQQGSLLIVDDDEMNRDMLAQRLELKGYSVTAADNGRQALALVDRHCFDLILLDVMMPDMNGLEVLRQLRRRHLPAELPVIMVTARDQSEDVVEAFNLGANDYVTKPIDLPVVLARIATQVSHKRSQAALRESEERYALAARGTNNGLWDWDLQTNQVYYSSRWKAMLGYDDSEIGSSPNEWLDRVHPEEIERVHEHLAANRRGCTPHFECEHRVLHKDKTYRWVMARGMAVRDSAGVDVRMAGSMTDVTEGKVSDPMTGLANRLLIADRVERAIERSQHDLEARFAVMFLDLDRFKLVNDCFGHLVGDQLLIAFARRLEGCVRAFQTTAPTRIETTIARLGGDEFTILLEGLLDPGDAVRVGERIQNELASPFFLGGQEVYTTASIGIANGGAGYLRADDLLRDADTAMYEAKAQGKARVEVFDAAMRARALGRIQLETELRGALERGELRLHYQPILSIQTGRLVGFEAMVRWQHPERGLLPPTEFLGVAEETALIVPIGWWALDEVYGQMRTWQSQFQDASSLTISVHIAPKLFFHKELVEEIQKRLKAFGLEGHWLKIEITESAFMSDPVTAAATLGQLRTLGVQVGIDDFGTGQSALNYLQRFPIDTLKLDRSFINRLTQTTKDQEIVQAIVTLAHNLGINVVAEGVESRQQLNALARMGCEFVQGCYDSSFVDGANAKQMLGEYLRKGGPMKDTTVMRAASCPVIETACSL